MILRFFIIWIFLISGLITGQSNESYSFKYDSIVKSLHYKVGDKINVYTQFEVNSKGEVRNITARGPHQIFEEKAIGIVKDLPKYNPTILKGKPIGSKFNLPIVFIIESENKKSSSN